MVDLTVLQLPPEQVEVGIGTEGTAVRRYIRTDEGRGSSQRHFIYEEEAGGLRLRAVGDSRAEADAKLGRSGIAWTEGGQPERDRVTARRREFLHAYVAALFGNAAKQLSVEQITDNAVEWIAKLPMATQKLLALAVWLLEKLLGSDFIALAIPARQARIVDRLDDFGGLLRDLGRLRTIFYASYFQDSRSWPPIGFVPPQERPNAEPFSDVDELRMSTLADNDKCDWLVIGSGAGGAAAAAALAAAGKDVLVLERGGYFPVKRMSHRDTEQYARLYVQGGLQTTPDRDVSVMQGNAIGGSSLINNAICFRPSEAGWTHPDAEDVIGKWAKDLSIDRAKLGQAFDHLEARLEVAPITKEQAGPNGQHLLDAWTAWLAGPNATVADRKAPARFFKKNYGTGARACWGCGYCNSGCPYFRKNSVAQTLLVDAQNDGARLVPDTEVLHINFGDADETPRRARSVEVRHRNKRRIVRVRDGIVVAAGVGPSTQILRSSGIETGRKLTCNLACTVAAHMPRKMDSWNGIQMAAYIDRGTHLIESWFHPPATFCGAVGGWFEDYLARMADYSKLVCMAVVMPTTAGEVMVDGSLQIRLDEDELKQLRGYVEDVVKLHFAGGADIVYLPDQTGRAVKPTDNISEIVKATFRKTKDFVLATAHPQGGNPMGRNAQMGTVGANLRVHGCRNLFVADASIFPSSIRVNPQMTIMAFAHARFSEE